jgi:hypothetical protein
MSNTTEQIINKTKQQNDTDPDGDQNSSAVIEKIRAHDWNQVSDEDSSTSSKEKGDQQKSASIQWEPPIESG